MGINLNIFNAVLFQLGWFLCVLGGNEVALWAAPAVVAVHLLYINDQPTEVWLLLAVWLAGWLWDVGLIAAGVLQLPNEQWWPPWWLTLLWPLFATLLNHALAWFKQRLLLAAVAALLFAPINYLAGTQLTGVSLGEPEWLSLVGVAVGWALLLPGLLWVADCLVGQQANRKAKQHA